MPNFFSHWLLGQISFQSSQSADSQLYSTIEKNICSFNLGTQGPDILFFYRIWPWVKSNGYETIGVAMHTTKVQTLFEACLSYIKNQSGREQDTLLAYFCGYISHYVLDKTTHPYIFYRSGFQVDDIHIDSKYGIFHRDLETSIDFIILKQLLNKTPGELNIEKLLMLKTKEKNTIAKMLCHCIGAVYNINLPLNVITVAIDDMINLNKVMFDKTGLKKRAVIAAENIFHKVGMASSTMCYTVPPITHDYLNEKNSLWYTPWSLGSLSNESFMDLFYKAEKETVKYILFLEKFRENQLSLEEMLKALGNCSFETGIDCNISLPFKHFESIYEQHKNSS